MALICILVFNLESYEYFRPVFVEVLSVMRFAKVILFHLHGKFIIEFIIKFLFLLSQMFPWMNKFLITENMFLSFSKIGKLQVFALHLPKFLGLEYA